MRNTSSAVTLVCLTFVAIITLFYPTLAVADTKYIWCRAKDADSKLYYSNIFPEPEDYSEKVGLATAFNNYVKSHYGANAPTARCEEPVGDKTESEARSDRDADSSKWVKVGAPVKFTHWKPAAVAKTDSGYIFCTAQDGLRVFFSAVFPQPEGFDPYSYIPSGFIDYVDSHYQANAKPGACQPPDSKLTASEAQSERARNADLWKRTPGGSVEFTNFRP